MLSLNEFKTRINKLPETVLSKTKKASYTCFKIEGDILHFERVIPKTKWSLNITTLYDIYKKYDFINTSIIKLETKGRVNSPSIAILMEIGCINKKGERI
jgi:hypothetical protein